jgi:ankyrin repeat protein
MVASLMRHGADPSIRDAEGSAALHIAAQFSFWPIVAFLSKHQFSSSIYRSL